MGEQKLNLLKRIVKLWTKLVSEDILGKNLLAKKQKAFQIGRFTIKKIIGIICLPMLPRFNYYHYHSKKSYSEKKLKDSAGLLSSFITKLIPVFSLTGRCNSWDHIQISWRILRNLGTKIRKLENYFFSVFLNHKNIQLCTKSFITTEYIKSCYIKLNSMQYILGLSTYKDIPIDGIEDIRRVRKTSNTE